jgi:hypothetical protein
VAALREPLFASHRKDGNEKKRKPLASRFADHGALLPTIGASRLDRRRGILADEIARAEQKNESAAFSPSHAVQRTGGMFGSQRCAGAVEKIGLFSR